MLPSLPLDDLDHLDGPVCRNCKAHDVELSLHNGAWWCRECLKDDNSKAHYEPEDFR